MKKLTSSLGLMALLALSLSAPVQADLIVDTGTPNLTGSALPLDSYQWLAAEFTTTASASQIDALQGYITAQDSNQAGTTFTVALYGNTTNSANKDIPDLATGELFSQQSTFNTDGWNGLQGLSVALTPGTYWVAFEVRPTDDILVRAADNLQGLMPVSAPNLVQTAANDNTTNFGYIPTTGTAYNFGVQVSAVPVPPALWMFATGLFAMVGRRFGKRKTV